MSSCRRSSAAAACCSSALRCAALSFAAALSTWRRSWRFSSSTCLTFSPIIFSAIVSGHFLSPPAETWDPPTDASERGDLGMVL